MLKEVNFFFFLFFYAVKINVCNSIWGKTKQNEPPTQIVLCNQLKVNSVFENQHNFKQHNITQHDILISTCFVIFLHPYTWVVLSFTSLFDSQKIWLWWVSPLPTGTWPTTEEDTIHENLLSWYRAHLMKHDIHSPTRPHALISLLFQSGFHMHM